MSPDDRVGVPVGDIRCDARHGEHGRRGGQANGAVDAARQGCGRVIAGRRAAVGAEPAADCSGRLYLPGGSAYRTQVGPGRQGWGMGSSSVTVGRNLGGRIRRELSRTWPNRAEVERLTWPSGEMPGWRLERIPMVRRRSTVRFRNGIIPR